MWSQAGNSKQASIWRRFGLLCAVEIAFSLVSCMGCNWQRQAAAWVMMWAQGSCLAKVTAFHLRGTCKIRKNTAMDSSYGFPGGWQHGSKGNITECSSTVTLAAWLCTTMSRIWEEKHSGITAATQLIFLFKRIQILCKFKIVDHNGICVIYRTKANKQKNKTPDYLCKNLSKVTA